MYNFSAMIQVKNALCVSYHQVSHSNLQSLYLYCENSPKEIKRRVEFLKFLFSFEKGMLILEDFFKYT